jgi:thiosulfate reductase cytochrome b subunit
MGAVILHYSYGIFLGRPHPYKVVPERKHNPLQRLAYLWLKLMINPLIWISGIAYLFYANWRDLAPVWLGLEQVALAHTLGAFMMLLFFIAHVYLTTTGHTPLAHIKAMITGWEDKH